MSRLLRNLLILFILVSGRSLAGDLPTTLHGESRRTIVNVSNKDSLIFVEYCHSNISGVWLTQFDTLKLINNKYVGRFSVIGIKERSYFFEPKHVKLSEGESDTSLNKYRNQGYLNYLDKQMKKFLTWTGADLNEFKSSKWVQKSHEIKDYKTFKSIALVTSDSLHFFYSSDYYCQRFNNLIIKDYRLFSKKYVISDSQKISKVWQYLSQNQANNRKLFPFIIQMPISIALMSLYDVDVALMATPIVYPALIGSEIFIGNRIHAKHTYKLKFYPASKDGMKLTLKVRRSTIICSSYTYQLLADFSTVLKDL